MKNGLVGLEGLVRTFNSLRTWLLRATVELQLMIFIEVQASIDLRNLGLVQKNKGIRERSCVWGGFEIVYWSRSDLVVFLILHFRTCDI
jgi:hypothetical protein